MGMIDVMVNECDHPLTTLVVVTISSHNWYHHVMSGAIQSKGWKWLWCKIIYGQLYVSCMSLDKDLKISVGFWPRLCFFHIDPESFLFPKSYISKMRRVWKTLSSSWYYFPLFNIWIPGLKGLHNTGTKLIKTFRGRDKDGLEGTKNSFRIEKERRYKNAR